MRKAIFISILSILLLGVGYVYWFYYNPYSSGYREGFLQKVSYRGNIFKTYEAEMVLQGFGQRSTGMVNSNFFYFSVSDKALADSLNKCMGKTMRVHYTQYRKCLPWRGENYNGKNSDEGQYVVDQADNINGVNPY